MHLGVTRKLSLPVDGIERGQSLSLRIKAVQFCATAGKQRAKLRQVPAV